MTGLTRQQEVLRGLFQSHPALCSKVVEVATGVKLPTPVTVTEVQIPVPPALDGGGVVVNVGEFPSLAEIPEETIGVAEGLIVGEAKAILRNLKNRGVSVDQEAKMRIVWCTDIETLDGWLDRSIEISEIGELFQD